MVVCRPQTWSKDLGGKMAGAFRDAFEEGSKFVVVVSKINKAAKPPTVNKMCTHPFINSLLLSYQLLCV